MKTASGAGRPASAGGAAPLITSSPGTPSAAAFLLTRAARSGRASTAIARASGSARIHSMPMLPLPAPTSHSSRAGPGRSAASASARSSRRVIWPSDS